VSEPTAVATREYNSVRLARSQLSDRDITVLAAIPDNLVQCTPVAMGWELRLGPVCGVLHLDHARIAVQPKLMPDGATVASWIGYASTVPLEVDTTRRWTVDTAGLPDVVISTLIRHCTTLLRDGLHRDYRRNEAADSVLRGRLDIGRQLSRRYGQVDILHMHRFDRDVAVWENLVCRAALDVASRLAGSGELRRKARATAAAFPACGAPPSTVRRWLATSRYHRMNDRYRGAHMWAGLLLNGGGVNDMLVDGPWNAGTLLINMNILWERVVQRLCADLREARPPGGENPGPIVVTEGGHVTRHFLPDAILASHDGAEVVRVPVDAKYKAYSTKALDRDDTHQLLTYAAAFRRPGVAPTAVVVHPRYGAGESRVVKVHAAAGSLGTITVVGVDAAGTVDEALATLRGLITLK
jgi:5-methylcytosine-specific restriction enzyme subunit McrC